MHDRLEFNIKRLWLLVSGISLLFPVLLSSTNIAPASYASSVEVAVICLL